MATLADRRFEMTLRNRVLFGVGEIDALARGGGARSARVAPSSSPIRACSAPGVIDHVLGILAEAGIETRDLHRRGTEPRGIDGRTRGGRAPDVRPG